MSLQQVMLAAGVACLAASLALAVEAVRFYVVHNVRGVRNDLLGRMRLDSSRGTIVCAAPASDSNPSEQPTEVIGGVVGGSRPNETANARGPVELGDGTETVDYRSEGRAGFAIAQCVLAYSKDDVLDARVEAL